MNMEYGQTPHAMELELRAPHIIVRCSCGWVHMLPEKSLHLIDAAIREHSNTITAESNGRLAKFKQAMAL